MKIENYIFDFHGKIFSLFYLLNKKTIEWAYQICSQSNTRLNDFIVKILYRQFAIYGRN